jgi:hypothetical protein
MTHRTPRGHARNPNNVSKTKRRVTCNRYHRLRRHAPGYLAIVPGDRDRVPTHSADSAAISGITPPEYSIAFLEIIRFGGGDVAPPSFSLRPAIARRGLR